MKRLTLLVTAVAAFAAFALLASVATTAQDQPTKIVFVDSQAAISAHPAGAASDALQEQATGEISGLRDQIQGYTDRIRAGQQLTPEENEIYQTLLTTIQTVQQRWQQEITATAEPALAAVNEAIAELADEQGYTIVMEFGVSATSGLVVYAQDGLDITSAVIARVSGGN
jgi:outer membrane protein